MRSSLAVLAAVLVGALSAIGAARLIEPSEPPVVPPIELREEPTQTSEKPRDKRPQESGPREKADGDSQPPSSSGTPPPPQGADPVSALPPAPAGDDDDDDDDDDGDDASDDAGESDD